VLAPCFNSDERLVIAVITVAAFTVTMALSLAITFSVSLAVIAVPAMTVAVAIPVAMSLVATLISGRSPITGFVGPAVINAKDKAAVTEVNGSSCGRAFAMSLG